MALDFGTKRTGIAVTDPLRIIATPLETVPTAGLLDFIRQYHTKETVDEFVIGMPKTLANEDSATAPHVRKFIEKLKEAFPDKKITEADERFTTTIALRTIAQSGLGKKARQEKGLADKISATLILQSFMGSGL